MALADVLISIGVFVAIYGILAFGMNIKYGQTGLLDFGHVAFYLVGAYTTALFILPPDRPGDFTTYVIGLGEVSLLGNWITGIVVATVLAGVIGGVVALPTIKLREDYLAITLLGVSVIFQRIIQSEEWLANGPDALRGYSPPLKSLFPLEPQTLIGAVLFGLIVAIIWTGLTALLLSIQHASNRRTHDGLVSLPTFGLASLNRRLFGFGVGTVSTGAGLVAGCVTVLLALAGGMVLTVGAVVSLYTWAVFAVGIWSWVDGLSYRQGGTGVLIGSGLMLALLPLPLLRGLGVKLGLTSIALIGLLAAVIWGIRTQPWLRHNSIKILGIGALWFFLLWYLLIPVVDPILQQGVAAAARALVENILWVLKFGGDAGIGYSLVFIGDLTLNIDYTRFVLTSFLLIVGVVYLLLETATRSPFGRVLRAVRNDEAVVQSLGKDPFTYKVQSMVIGSALAGLAGGLWAVWAQGLVFTMFAPRVTFLVLLILFIGGVGNNKGMIAGAVVYWAFQEATTQLAGFFPPEVRVNILSFRLVVIGVLFLVVLYYLPEGLLPRSGRSIEDHKS